MNLNKTKKIIIYELSSKQPLHRYTIYKSLKSVGAISLSFSRSCEFVITTCKHCISFVGDTFSPFINVYIINTYIHVYAPSTTLLIIICIRGVQSENKFFFTAYKYICNRINTGSGDTKNGGTFSE